MPQANLANFDPIWGTQYVVRNAAALVWDMLYGFDDKLVPQRQMVESETISDDRLTWTFKLRSGLKWHDGAPVTAKDCVASLSRWAVRDPMGQMIIAIQQELTATDERCFKWVLKKPYPKLLRTALGKNNDAGRLHDAGAHRQRPIRSSRSTTTSAASPAKFVKNEWVHPAPRPCSRSSTATVPRDELRRRGSPAASGC